VLVLQSYVPPGGVATIPDGHNWTIVDAALATTAAPGFFRRHMVTTESEYFFEDAGAHCVNNPTQLALDECPKLKETDPLLDAANGALFVSLGTGTWSDIHTTSGVFGLFKNKLATLKASLRHATTVKQVHESMKMEAQVHNLYVWLVTVELRGSLM
jgi:patatin-like phospholipase/acyl hydrolase